MTNAVPIRIADAVVSQINGESFDIGAFTAVRSSGSWDKDFKGLETMAVDAIYRKRGMSITMAAHGVVKYVVEILIVVRKRFPQSDRDTETGEILVAAVDPLDTLLVDIAKFFVGRRNTGVLDDEADASYEPEDITPSLANEMYLRRGLYYGFIPIVFSLKEAI